MAAADRGDGAGRLRAGASPPPRATRSASSPGRSTRWPPSSPRPTGCAATSSPTCRTSCARRSPRCRPCSRTSSTASTDPDPETFRTMLAQVERLGRLVQAAPRPLPARVGRGAARPHRVPGRAAARRTRCASSSCTRPTIAVVGARSTPTTSPPTATPSACTRWSPTCSRTRCATRRAAARSRCGARRTTTGVTIEVHRRRPRHPRRRRRPRVFERFYRADAARAVERRRRRPRPRHRPWIVDLHGGDIHPERREPHGCRMVVDPARPTTVPDDPDANEADP